jgi:hypothetical protein
MSESEFLKHIAIELMSCIKVDTLELKHQKIIDEIKNRLYDLESNTESNE